MSESSGSKYIQALRQAQRLDSETTLSVSRPSGAAWISVCRGYVHPVLAHMHPCFWCIRTDRSRLVLH